jgi:hypothetical protein
MPLVERKKVKENDPKVTPKTLMPSTLVQKLDGSENPKGNPKGDHVAHM